MKKMKVMDIKKSIRTSFHFMIIVLALFNVVYLNHFNIMYIIHVSLHLNMIKNEKNNYSYKS